MHDPKSRAAAASYLDRNRADAAASTARRTHQPRDRDLLEVERLTRQLAEPKTGRG
jgi:hypothetical protein